jgi:cytochrome c peroxidase
MRKIVVSGLLFTLIVAAGFRKKNTLFQVPGGWPKPGYNFRKHPLSAEKILLGRVLFYDPVLSRDSTISCASCHSQYSAFTHVDHSLSHGIEGKTGIRNSPALMNLAWGKRFMWDGSVEHIGIQAVKPITNPLEMDEKMEHVARKLQATRRYPALFYAAFGDSAVSQDHIMASISEFMLTLVSANSKYDRVQRGEAVFTEDESKGYRVFRRHCSSCHTEPLFTNEGFENNGLAPDDSLKDYGLMRITGDAGDSLKFKVPTLRNVAYTAPYMHDGRFKTLSMVLNNYIMGLQHGPTLSPKLKKGIYMTAEEKACLISFLMTLSDKEFISNPLYAYPKI